MAIVYETTNLINGKKYIGVDSKDDPEYLGSGKLLKKAILKYGKDNFTKKVINEFKTAKDAFQFEREIIKKLDAVSSKNYYNIHEGGKGGKTWIGDKRPESHCQAISDAVKGRIPWNKNIPRSSETKKKLSLAKKGVPLSLEHRENISKGMKNLPPISLETRKKISESLKGREFSNEHKLNLSNSLKGRDPWNKGKTDVYSEETLKKMSSSKSGKNNPMFGRKHKEDSIKHLRSPKEKVTCPHCNTVGGGGSMIRWHFDNCRHKKDKIIINEN